MVGPKRNTKTRMPMARIALVLASHLMPLWVPLTAETTKAAVRPAMTTIATVLLVGASKTRVRPELIWMAPRPSEVAAPKVVMKMAKMSMARRAGWLVGLA